MVWFVLVENLSNLELLVSFLSTQPHTCKNLEWVLNIFLTFGALRFHFEVSYSVFLCFQEIKSNKTVLHLAVKEGNIQLVRHLLKTPLDNMRDFVNMKVSAAVRLSALERCRETDLCPERLHEKRKERHNIFSSV